jgi:hypothetical protein
MPVQMIRASKGHVTSHIRDNMWLWIGIFAAATLVLGLLQLSAGRRGMLGDLASFAGAVLGILVMVKSQEGFVSTHVATDEDDEEADLAPPIPPTTAPV